MNETVTILLATYNGEKYLPVQLDSIVNQTYTNWHLIIRDDCSKDSTPSIIAAYKNKYFHKITVLENNKENTGCVLNFSALLTAASHAKYVMFCDQDDKWLPEKIKTTFDKMIEVENIHSSKQPILIFTDFLYVDNELQPIASKKNFHITQIPDVRLAHLLAQNHIHGCTMMINQALTIKANPIPAAAENHDYWIAMVAAAFGVVHYINQRTILYRQHGTNVSGSFDDNSFKKRFLRNIIERRNFKDANKKYAMLKVFTEKYYSRLTVANKAALDNFLHLYHSRNPLLLIKNINNAVRCQTVIQTVLLYVTLIVRKQTKPVV